MGMVSSSDKWGGPIPPDPPEPREHEWEPSRFTGNMTCAVCNLLPDDPNIEDECKGGDEE